MTDLLAFTVYLLEALILWRLWKWKAWRHFPVFCAYFLFLIARQALNAYLEQRWGTHSLSYARSFWYSAGLADLFKLFVAWEVYRQAFPRGSAAQSFAGALLVATLAGLAAFYFLGGAHDTNFFVAIGLNASFAVTIWILGVLALVQYYHIALSTNLWGIALGLGLFSASSIVNYSTLGLNQQALPVFGFIRGTSFLTGLLIWTSCLWSFRPAPALTAPPPPDAPPFPPPLEAGAAAVRRALRLKPGPAPDSKEN